MVMGMEAFLAVSLSCCLAPPLITTYRFLSLSAACSDSLGPHLLQRGREGGRDEEEFVSLPPPTEGDELPESGKVQLSLPRLLRGRLQGIQVHLHHVLRQTLREREIERSGELHRGRRDQPCP